MFQYILAAIFAASSIISFLLGRMTAQDELRKLRTPRTMRPANITIKREAVIYEVTRPEDLELDFPNTEGSNHVRF